MQAVGIILTLITIGTILGPIGAVVVIYREDLTQLVIPPELTNLLNHDQNGDNNSLNPNDNNYNGDSPFNPNGNPNNYNISTSDDFSDFFQPKFISAEIDPETNICTIKFELTNNKNSDTALNALNSDMAVTKDMYPAGVISLSTPITIPSGQTATVTITGYLTQEAQNYIQTNYPDLTEAELYATNMSLNINGMYIQVTDVIDVGSIPVNS